MTEPTHLGAVAVTTSGTKYVRIADDGREFPWRQANTHWPDPVLRSWDELGEVVES